MAQRYVQRTSISWTLMNGSNLMPRNAATRHDRADRPRREVFKQQTGSPPLVAAARYPSLARSYAIPGVAILPLRLFLGLTFVYAGIQKLTDSGFFRAGSPTYIGAQLLAFSRGSPIAFLLDQMMGQAVAIGALTILTEMAIGLLVLLGLLTRPAVLIGLILNLMFFLSASWHTYPYFFGSDIVFVMCWLTLALTGPGPFALDSLAQVPIRQRLRRRFGHARADAIASFISGPLGPPTTVGQEPGEEGTDPALSSRSRMNRAEALVGAAATVVFVLLGLPRKGGATPAGKTIAATPQGSSGSTGGASGSTGGGSQSGVPAGFKKIGNTTQLPANSGGTVSDPKTGDPAIIVHTSGSNYYAYDAVCTHAGCTVQYDPQQRLLVCPCHGGAFDPTHGAQVVAGPPPSPLSPIEMKIDSQGNIYIV